MAQPFSTHLVAGAPDSARAVSRFRLVVQVEVALLLFLAVALTVAPQVVLDWVAVVAGTARDFSSSYRSVVALVGLLLVAVAAVGLWLLLRPRRGAARALDAMVSGTSGRVGEDEDIEGGGKRRVA